MSDTHFLQHLARDGDRWDSLSWQYYADAYGYERIICANPHLPIDTVLKAGQVVLIPIISPDITQEELPPWLR